MNAHCMVPYKVSNFYVDWKFKMTTGQQKLTIKKLCLLKLSTCLNRNNNIVNIHSTITYR